MFCQKPLTLTLEENQLIRNACKKHSDKVFFVGTQQRIDRGKFLRPSTWSRKGLLGDIKKITVGINGGDQGGPFPIAMPPSELDWENMAGSGAAGRLSRETLPLPVPLVVRILGRQIHRLGCAPRRHRHLGDRTRQSRAWGRSRSTAPTPSIPCEFKDGYPT